MHAKNWWTLPNFGGLWHATEMISLALYIDFLAPLWITFKIYHFRSNNPAHCVLLENWISIKESLIWDLIRCVGLSTISVRFRRGWTVNFSGFGTIFFRWPIYLQVNNQVCRVAKLWYKQRHRVMITLNMTVLLNV